MSERGNALAQAVQIVDAGLQACEAFDRPDLAARLATARRTLADPVVHIVVVGEFKQGKSSLVNALVGANVCPVDDDVATAVPTYVRFGQEATAHLLFDQDPPPAGGGPGQLRREPIPLNELRRYVVEDPAAAAGPSQPTSTAGLSGVEIKLPRRLLAGGLVLVDTPGVGGLGSAHAAASLAAASLADALLFVTDAAQELTRTELDFLGQARQMCPAVACALTKTDFYPYWRRIRDLNAGHLREHPDIPVFPVSASLRMRAVTRDDKDLNTTSGYPELLQFITQRVGTDATTRLAARAANEVLGVCEQVASQFEAELAALADPAAAARVTAELNQLTKQVEGLRAAAARWSQTLSDGIADLTSDIDHDLRGRIRRVIEEADQSIDDSDPADTWHEMEPWLQARISNDLLANYTLLRDRATVLSEEVGEHFQDAAGQVLRQVAVPNPTPTLATAEVEHKIELAKMGFGKQAMVALKAAYGGALMFVMLGAMTGITLGPIGLGIGLVMGRKGLREEKKRQMQSRQQQAKNAVRRYCDEVTFVMSKDSRDTLRRIHRQLRDHYTTLAEELGRSHAQALAAAQEAQRRTQAERTQRQSDLSAELERLAQLRRYAEAVAA